MSVLYCDYPGGIPGRKPRRLPDETNRKLAGTRVLLRP